MHIDGSSSMHGTNNDRVRRLIADLARVHALMTAAQHQLECAIEAHDTNVPTLRKQALAATELVVEIQEKLLQTLKDLP